MTIPQLNVGNFDPNRSILISIVLSVVLTLILWGIQSLFHLNPFWTFVVYVGLLFLLFYFILPKVMGGTKTGVVISQT